MNPPAGEFSGQFDAGNHTNPGLHASINGSLNAIEGVVVGDCDGIHTTSLGFEDEIFRRERPIRSGRMAMEVDI